MTVCVATEQSGGGGRGSTNLLNFELHAAKTFFRHSQSLLTTETSMKKQFLNNKHRCRHPVQAVCYKNSLNVEMWRSTTSKISLATKVVLFSGVNNDMHQFWKVLTNDVVLLKGASNQKTLLLYVLL